MKVTNRFVDFWLRGVRKKFLDLEPVETIASCSTAWEIMLSFSILTLKYSKETEPLVELPGRPIFWSILQSLEYVKSRATDVHLLFCREKLDLLSDFLFDADWELGFYSLHDIQETTYGRLDFGSRLWSIRLMWNSHIVMNLQGRPVPIGHISVQLRSKKTLIVEPWTIALPSIRRLIIITTEIAHKKVIRTLECQFH